MGQNKIKDWYQACFKKFAEIACDVGNCDIIAWFYKGTCDH